MFINKLILFLWLTELLGIRAWRRGFVYVSDGQFKLNNKKFYFAGTNAYYLPFGVRLFRINLSQLYFFSASTWRLTWTQSRSDVAKGFKAGKKAGLHVFRSWGFNDHNATTDPNGMPQYGDEGAGETNVYFQTWKNGVSKIDLKGLDKVVNAANNQGVKLIVTLTNNWADYGGMDVYTVNLGGQYHDDASRSLMLICVTR